MKYLHLKQFLSILIFFLSSFTSNGQQNGSIPKNFVGISGNLVFNGFSGAIALDAERYLVTKNRFAVAVRGVRVFKYTAGNLNPIYGPDKNLTSTHWQVWIDGYFFTSVDKATRGFYINTGLGLTSTVKNEKLTGPPPMLIKSTGTMPAIEVGIGYPININDKLVIKLGFTGSVYLPKNKSLGPGNMIGLRAAFGF